MSSLLAAALVGQICVYNAIQEPVQAYFWNRYDAGGVFDFQLIHPKHRYCASSNGVRMFEVRLFPAESHFKNTVVLPKTGAGDQCGEGVEGQSLHLRIARRLPVQKSEDPKVDALFPRYGFECELVSQGQS